MAQNFTVEKGIRVLIGSLVLMSLGLGYFVHRGWLLLGVFVGVNLIQSAFTGVCLGEGIMKNIFGLKNSEGSCCGKKQS